MRQAQPTSITLEFARQHNLFEMTQFSEARDVLKVANAAADPAKAKKLREDPAFAALEKDQRWRKAVADPDVKRALEQGDVQALLRSDAVAKLLQDAALVRNIEAASGATGEW